MLLVICLSEQYIYSKANVGAEITASCIVTHYNTYIITSTQTKSNETKKLTRACSIFHVYLNETFIFRQM